MVHISGALDHTFPRSTVNSLIFPSSKVSSQKGKGTVAFSLLGDMSFPLLFTKAELRKYSVANMFSQVMTSLSLNEL